MDTTIKKAATEKAKMACGKAHFEALDSGVAFIKTSKMKDVEDVVYG